MRLPIAIALVTLFGAPATAQVRAMRPTLGTAGKIGRLLPGGMPPLLDSTVLRTRIGKSGSVQVPAEAPITSSGEVGPANIVDGNVYIRINAVSLWTPGGPAVAELNGFTDPSNWIVNYAAGPTAYAIDCKVAFEHATAIAFEFWDDNSGSVLGSGAATFGDNHLVAAIPPFAGKNIAVRFLPKLSDGVGRLWGCRVLKLG